MCCVCAFACVLLSCFVVSGLTGFVIVEIVCRLAFCLFVHFCTKRCVRCVCVFCWCVLLLVVWLVLFCIECVYLLVFCLFGCFLCVVCALCVFVVADCYWFVDSFCCFLKVFVGWRFACLVVSYVLCAFCVFCCYVLLLVV